MNNLKLYEIVRDFEDDEEVTVEGKEQGLIKKLNLFNSVEETGFILDLFFSPEWV